LYLHSTYRGIKMSISRSVANISFHSSNRNISTYCCKCLVINKQEVVSVVQKAMLDTYIYLIVKHESDNILHTLCAL
jgi:hypothetical protein